MFFGGTVSGNEVHVENLVCETLSGVCENMKGDNAFANVNTRRHVKCHSLAILEPAGRSALAFFVESGAWRHIALPGFYRPCGTPRLLAKGHPPYSHSSSNPCGFPIDALRRRRSRASTWMGCSILFVLSM